MVSTNNKIVNVGFFPGFSLLMAIIGILLMLFGQHLAQPTGPGREPLVAVPDAELSGAAPSKSSDQYHDRQPMPDNSIWL